MSEIITKGYLINSIDYEIFDEIITFLNEHGRFFSCIAKGVKKINSKNARHLKMGALLEFDFFNSRDINSIGKLKKVISIEKNDFSFSIKPSLLFLNQMYYKFKINSKKTYDFYINSIEFIKNDNNDEISILKSIFIFLKIIGIKLNLESCYMCKSKKIANFSLDKMSFVCIDCNTDYIKFDSNTIKILFFLDTQRYHHLNTFEKNKIIVVIKILLSIIKNNSGVDLYSLIKY